MPGAHPVTAFPGEKQPPCQALASGALRLPTGVDRAPDVPLRHTSPLKRAGCASVPQQAPYSRPSVVTPSSTMAPGDWPQRSGAAQALPRPRVARVLYLEPEKDTWGCKREPRSRAWQYPRARGSHRQLQPPSLPPHPRDRTGTREAPREAKSRAHRPQAGKGRAG